MIQLTPELETKIQAIQEGRFCHWCGNTENVLPGAWAHVGGYGNDLWQPPHCADLDACERRRKESE